MNTPQTMRVEFFEDVNPWAEDPVETLHQLTDDELVSLLWRGEDPKLPGFYAGPDDIKVKASTGEQPINEAVMRGYTARGGYLYRTNLLIKPQGMFARFISKQRNKPSPNWAFRERAMIASGRILNPTEV